MLDMVMLHRLIRYYVFILFSLYLTSFFLVRGFIIPLDLAVYLRISFLFSVLSVLIKPVLKVIFFPVNMLTLGLFSFFLNAFILYILKILAPEVRFTTTFYPGFSSAGFLVPAVSLNTPWTVLAASFSLTVLDKFLNWLAEN